MTDREQTFDESDVRERRVIRRGFLAGTTAGMIWMLAGVGWAAHWNAYINLLLSICGAVIVWTGIACTLDRYQR